MQENRMGTMPVGKLLFSMSMPMIMSMLMQALYNIVDSIFVARVSEDALAAVSLCFPITNLMIALGVGTGVGVNAMAARYLGAKRQDDANNVATQGVWLAGFTAIVFMAIVTFLAEPFFVLLTDDKVILGYCLDYARIIGWLSFGLFFQTMLEKLMQATGRPIYSMITQMTGAIINIILDPIMIFGYFGFPRMEVMGAALATVIGQICATIVGFILNHKKNKELKISLIKYKPQWRPIKTIYKIGIPSIILASVGSIMNFGLNKILMAFSSTAAAVFGAYFRLQSFIFMPVFGINNGMVPIIAFNYGAKKPDRIKQTLKLTYICATAIMIVGMLAFEIFPEALLTLFDASEKMMKMGTYALRVIGTHFILAGFCIMSSSFFQAMGHATVSMVQSILRQLAVILPAAYILAEVGGLNAVWWAFPIAELTSVVFCIFYVMRVMKKTVNPLYENGKEESIAVEGE